MIYVASPYSHPDHEVIDARYRKVVEFIDHLVINAQLAAFSPIVYCHPIALRHGWATDAKTWMKFNMSMLRRAEQLYVLQLEGWEKSVGVTLELKVAKLLNIEVCHFAPNFQYLGSGN